MNSFAAVVRITNASVSSRSVAGERQGLAGGVVEPERPALSPGSALLGEAVGWHEEASFREGIPEHGQHRGCLAPGVDDGLPAGAVEAEARWDHPPHPGLLETHDPVVVSGRHVRARPVQLGVLAGDLGAEGASCLVDVPRRKVEAVAPSPGSVTA
jgi:hypothetical protein